MPKPKQLLIYPHVQCPFKGVFKDSDSQYYLSPHVLAQYLGVESKPVLCYYPTLDCYYFLNPASYDQVLKYIQSYL